MTRLLFLVQLPPPVHGVSVINDLIRKSDRINDRYSVTYLNITTSREISDIGKSGYWKYFSALKTATRLVWELVSKKYSAVYFTLSPIGPAFRRDSIYVSIIQLFQIPIVFHLHGKGISRTIEDNPKALDDYLKVFKDSTVIHLSSRLLYDISMIKTLGSTEILWNGLPGKSSTPRTSPKTHSILFMSNMMKEKGAYELLLALKILKEMDVSFTANFAGAWVDTDYKNKMELFCQSHFTGMEVQLLGPVYGEEKEQLLTKSDIFVLPTYYPNECFPLTLIEATRHCIPIIATSEGAIEDIVEDGITGLISSTSPDDLSEHLQTLISDQHLYEKMSYEAGEKFDRDFRFEIFESKFISILDKAIG